MEISSINCLSQTVRARERKVQENVHHPPCATFHALHFICHMSCVTCHMSYVIFFWGGGGQNVGVCQRRVCYQQGLPCLVFLHLNIFLVFWFHKISYSDCLFFCIKMFCNLFHTFFYHWWCFFWYWCFYPHWSIDLASPVCGILFSHFVSILWDFTGLLFSRTFYCL